MTSRVSGIRICSCASQILNCSLTPLQVSTGLQSPADRWLVQLNPFFADQSIADQAIRSAEGTGRHDTSNRDKLVLPVDPFIFHRQQRGLHSTASTSSQEKPSPPAHAGFAVTKDALAYTLHIVPDKVVDTGRDNMTLAYCVVLGLLAFFIDPIHVLMLGALGFLAQAWWSNVKKHAVVSEKLVLDKRLGWYTFTQEVSDGAASKERTGRLTQLGDAAVVEATSVNKLTLVKRLMPALRRRGLSIPRIIEMHATDEKGGVTRLAFGLSLSESEREQLASEMNLELRRWRKQQS